MASTYVPDEEFSQPRRIQLIQALQGALPDDTIPPTAWACLWLSDLDMLEEIVKQAKAAPLFAACFFQCVETNPKIAQTCKLLILSLGLFTNAN